MSSRPTNNHDTPEPRGSALREVGIESGLFLKDHADTIRPALPGQLFYCTQIPVSLWFLANNKAADTVKHVY